MEANNAISGAVQPIADFFGAALTPVSLFINEFGKAGNQIVTPIAENFGLLASPFLDVTNQLADTLLNLETAIVSPFVQATNGIKDLEAQFKETERKFRRLKNPMSQINNSNNNNNINQNIQNNSLRNLNSLSSQNIRQLANNIDEHLNSVSRSLRSNSGLENNNQPRDITNLNAFRLV